LNENEWNGVSGGWRRMIEIVKTNAQVRKVWNLGEIFAFIENIGQNYQLQVSKQMQL
jgi:hypothetical protein